MVIACAFSLTELEDYVLKRHREDVLAAWKKSDTIKVSSVLVAGFS
jgi:hypothetical protein